MGDHKHLFLHVWRRCKRLFLKQGRGKLALPYKLLFTESFTLRAGRFSIVRDGMWGPASVTFGRFQG